MRNRRRSNRSGFFLLKLVVGGSVIVLLAGAIFTIRRQFLIDAAANQAWIEKKTAEHVADAIKIKNRNIGLLPKNGRAN